jgi:hypothetical protein
VRHSPKQAEIIWDKKFSRLGTSDFSRLGTRNSQDLGQELLKTLIRNFSRFGTIDFFHVLGQELPKTLDECLLKTWDK